MKKFISTIEQILYYISGALILSLFNTIVMIVSFASLILIPSGVKCIKRYKYIFSKQQFDFCINYKKAPVFNTIYLILGGGIVYCLLKLIGFLLEVTLIFYYSGKKVIRLADLFLFPFGVEYEENGKYFKSKSKQAQKLNGKYVFFRMVNAPSMLLIDNEDTTLYAKDILLANKENILKEFNKQKKKTKQKLLISTIIPLILIPILITIGILIKDITEVPFIYFKHYPFVNAIYCFLFTLFRVFLYIYYKKYAPITIDFKQFAKYVLLVDQFAYEYKEKYINFDKYFKILENEEKIKEIEYNDKN